MQKTARKIFQPTPLTAMLLDGENNATGMNISDIINFAIQDYFMPKNDFFNKEINFVFNRLEKNEIISEEENKAILARCIESLQDNPISDVSAIEDVFEHFINRNGRHLRYDYIKIVDPAQDAILHRLNDIIKTLEPDYQLGTRELGERCRYIFRHWKKLCAYTEVYTALAVIIELENVYYKLDTFRTIALVRNLDKAVEHSSLEPIKTPYETNISLTDRYYGLSYEIVMYQSDNAYVALSGDQEFKNMSPEIKDYYEHLKQKGHIYGDATEEDVAKVVALEEEGHKLFRRLTKSKIQN